MYTLFGQEAKDGDFVLVQDVRYIGGADNLYVAQVRGDKAYAAAAIRSSDKVRWLRKETAVIIISASEVSEQDKKVIRMNMDAPKATFAPFTEYFKQASQLIADAADARTKDKILKYGDEYKYR